MLSDRSRVSSESPARLEVRLLGAVEVILDGRRLGAFNSLRLQRFLALLALRRDLQHRSRLAFELWPDSDERQARTNLRKLLHDFRHALPDIGEFVQIDNEIVRYSLSPTRKPERAVSDSAFSRSMQKPQTGLASPPCRTPPG